MLQSRNSEFSGPPRRLFRFPWYFLPVWFASRGGRTAENPRKIKQIISRHVLRRTRSCHSSAEKSVGEGRGGNAPSSLGDARSPRLLRLLRAAFHVIGSPRICGGDRCNVNLLLHGVATRDQTDRQTSRTDARARAHPFRRMHTLHNCHGVINRPVEFKEPTLPYFVMHSPPPSLNTKMLVTCIQDH